MSEKSKKLLTPVLFFLLVIAGGFFSGAEKSSAAEVPNGVCAIEVRTGVFQQNLNLVNVRTTKTDCAEKLGKWYTVEWTADVRPPSTAEIVSICRVQGPASEGSAPYSLSTTSADCTKIDGLEVISAEWEAPVTDPDEQARVRNMGSTAFEEEMEKFVCGIGGSIAGVELPGSLWPGCVVNLFYGLLYVLPAFLLVQVAYFFNVMIQITLSSALFQSGFVASAWGVVRDLSNIFFILILLYVAVEIILGLAHDAKKTISKVIVAALLINFSMFFTGIIIDTSNILALVFYNKLTVNTTENGATRSYAKVGAEKDVAGGMVAKFDPTRPLKPEFFAKAKEVYIEENGKFALYDDGRGAQTPVGIILGLILITGLVMGFAMYALFVSAFAFLGRLIELWILIIASPFAFMSSTLHKLESIKDWGWHSWFHRLVAAAFMAPMFMFFLYFIFMLIDSNIFQDMVKNAQAGTADAAGFVRGLLQFVLPALLIMILLLKSVKIAKIGSGQVGDMLTKAGEKIAGAAGGLALGAATGGAGLALGAGAALGRNTAGRVGANLAESERMRAWAAKSSIGKMALKGASGLASSSFDVRGTGMTGKKFGKAQEGGFTKARQEKVKKEEEFAKKFLDVSDYGRAELTRGNMDEDKAADIVEQIAEGMKHEGKTLSDGDKLRMRMELSSNGLELKEAKSVSAYINTARRNQYADRLEKRAAFWGSAAGARRASKRIAANKIRKTVSQQHEEHNLGELVEKLKHAEHEHGHDEKKHEEEHTPPAHQEEHHEETASGGTHGTTHP